MKRVQVATTQPAIGGQINHAVLVERLERENANDRAAIAELEGQLPALSVAAFVGGKQEAIAELEQISEQKARLLARIETRTPAIEHCHEQIRLTEEARLVTEARGRADVARTRIAEFVALSGEADVILDKLAEVLTRRQVAGDRVAEVVPVGAMPVRYRSVGPLLRAARSAGLEVLMGIERNGAPTTLTEVDSALASHFERVDQIKADGSFVFKATVSEQRAA